MGVNPRDFNPRRQAQDFGNAGRSGVADVLLGDDIDRGWSGLTFTGSLETVVTSVLPSFPGSDA